jgi:diguanylate cyclase (GGDEF)-like protein/PAS domain S-box-containing protein
MERRAARHRTDRPVANRSRSWIVHGPEVAITRMSSLADRLPPEDSGAGAPEGSSSRAGISPTIKRNAARWVAVLLALNVAMGMAYSVVILRRDGDRYRDIGATIARIEERLSLQHSLLGEASSSPAVSVGARPTVLIAGLRSISSAVEGDLASFERGASPLEVAAGIPGATRAHLRLVADEIARVAGGSQGDESRADLATSFERLDARLAEARSAAVERGADALRTADIESVLMMGLAALMAVLLNKKFNSARRGAAERAAHERAEAEARFRSLVQNANDVILICAPDTTIRYQTPSAMTVLGFGDDELLDTRLSELVHPHDAGRVLALCSEIGAHPGAARMIDWRMRHADGSWVHISSTASNMIDDPNVGGLVMTLRDNSEQKSLEEQLTHQAFHDSLTKLANRALFSDRVGHALMRADRTGHDAIVLFVDVDDFKTVNDSLGHAAGDDLLIEIAARLEGAVRPSDTVARLGGDEFAILLEDMSNITDAQIVAERILTDFESSIEIQNRELFVRASIGIASSANREEGAEELLRNADVAMYTAKGAGKGTYVIFEPTMHEAALDRLELKGAMERALEFDEFRLHYQPIVDLTTGGICGVEALVRWQRGDTLVPPMDFIPLAEETGFIHKLGSWVLMEACRQGREWQERYPLAEPLGINVNVSVQQILQPTLVEAVSAALFESGLDPATLTLEITEHDLLRGIDEVVGRLEALKTLGVRIAIDDFGTGYSSLSYLGRFPVDVLRIDRSFMARLAEEGEAALTEAVVQLGRTLSLEVVAEGIEELEQLLVLRTLDCGRGQGFYFARPLDHKACQELMDRGLSPMAAGRPKAEA